NAPFLHRKVLDQSIADSLNDTAFDLPLMADRVHDRSSIVSRGETAQSHFTRFPVDENLSHLCRKGGHRSMVVISIHRLTDYRTAHTRARLFQPWLFLCFFREEISAFKGGVGFGPAELLFGKAKCFSPGAPCSLKGGSPGPRSAAATADTAVKWNTGISVQYL